MHRPLPAYLAEFAGTALLLFAGVSAVALLWAPGSPVPAVPNEALRRLLTGGCFAAALAAVVYSPLGQISGAHLNPAVTLAFWRLGKIPARDALAYAAMQFLGAFAGTYAAGVACGRLAIGVHYGATLPGDGYTWAAALAAETAVTFLLVLLIVVCVNRPGLAPRTGLLAAALVAILVMIEAPVTGASLNPARSLAPAVLARTYTALWVYFAGPLAGALLAAAAFTGQSARATVCAKIYHTETYRCPFASCHYRLVKAGDTVMTAGEPGGEAYMVERGRLEVRHADAGAGAALARLERGDWVGEMSLLLDEPRSATVVATTDAQLRRVTRQDLAHMLAADTARTEDLLRQLARRVKAANARVAGRA